MSCPGLAYYLADATGAAPGAFDEVSRDWRGALEAAFQSRLAALAEDASMPLCVLLPAADPAPVALARTAPGDLLYGNAIDL